jgi:ubiquinone/menaquinone biosynthesis C-methylase UbiE
MEISPLSQVGQRFFAWQMSKMTDADERTIELKHHPSCANLAQLRQTLVGQLQGRVVEIGAGAGANFRYYPQDIEWIGVEPNPFMHPYLEQEADKQGLQVERIEACGAESMAVADHSVDAVVSTHVLCSVGDRDGVFEEIKRILKPQGQFVFLEHVAADANTWTHRLQNGLNPVWKRVFDGCHLNRTTGEAIAQAGFTDIQLQEFELKVPIVSPHVAGVAYTPAS